MAAPPRPRRQPTPWTLMALDVIASCDITQVRRNEFELRMHQRGCDAREVAQAIAALERRGWMTASGSLLSVSEAGHLAARHGVGLPPPLKKRPRRRERLPSGLL